MSLDLDERQRAMLQEMDVHFWWPRAPAPATATVAATMPASVPPVKVAVAATPGVAGKPPVGTPIAPKNIANNSIDTGVNASNGHQGRPEDLTALDWLGLQQAVASCQACKLCENRKNTVFGVGQPALQAQLAPQVDWLLVGEAPGENEDLVGEPFVGQAGKLLDNMLKAIGLNRHSNVYIANVIKCRPPGNRNPEPAEVVQCEPYLRRQIELLQPKIILAMGRFAVNTLLADTVPDVQKLPLGKLRGQVHGYHSAGRVVPVIATYHPAYLLRNLPEKAKSWADLCLALDVMAGSA